MRYVIIVLFVRALSTSSAELPVFISFIFLSTHQHSIKRKHKRHLNSRGTVS